MLCLSVTTPALMNIHLVAPKCLHLIMEISITEQTTEYSLIPARVKTQCLAYECQLSQINSADAGGSVSHIPHMSEPVRVLFTEIHAYNPDIHIPFILCL